MTLGAMFEQDIETTIENYPALIYLTENTPHAD